MRPAPVHRDHNRGGWAADASAHPAAEGRLAVGEAHAAADGGAGGGKVVERFRLLGRAMAKALQDCRLLDIPLSYTFYRRTPALALHRQPCSLPWVSVWRHECACGHASRTASIS